MEPTPQPTQQSPQPKKHWLPVLIALIILIVGGGFLLWLAKEAKDTNQEIKDQQTPTDNQQPADDGLTITNKVYGYSFKITPDFSTENELEGGIAEQAYFPKPGWKTADSVALNETTFNGTNFGSGIMTVAVHPKITTQAECNTYDAGSGVKQLTTTQNINNVTFHTGSFTGAAAGTKYDTKLYHVLHNGMCYEINATVGISNIGNYEPGTIKEVNEDDVWKKFDEVINTFTFITPAKADTSNWNTYSNAKYGIELKYPTEKYELEASGPQELLRLVNKESKQAAIECQCGEISRFILQAYPNPKNLDLVAFAKATFPKEYSDNTLADGEFSGVHSITFGEMTSYQLFAQGNTIFVMQPSWGFEDVRSTFKFTK